MVMLKIFLLLVVVVCVRGKVLPTTEGKNFIYLFICLFVCLFVCLFIYLFIYCY